MNDVNTDARGHYLLMSNGVGRQVKVYVPEFKWEKLSLDNKNKDKMLQKG